VLPWYFGGGTALLCRGHGMSCKCLASGLLGSMVAICGGGGGWKRWLCGGTGGGGS
jgi:hypothetical protein